MQAWALSIVGIVSLSMLIDIILPKGDISKYIKGVFSIMTICMIVAPLPRIISDIKNQVVDVPTFESIEVDNGLLHQLNEDKLVILEDNIQKLITSSGGHNVEVNIEDDYLDDEIDSIAIYSENIDNDKIYALLHRYLKIKVKEVKIVGKNSG